MSLPWAYFAKEWHAVAETRWPSARFACGLFFDGRDSSYSSRLETREGEVEASGRPRCARCLEKEEERAKT